MNSLENLKLPASQGSLLIDHVAASLDVEWSVLLGTSPLLVVGLTTAALLVGLLGRRLWDWAMLSRHLPRLTAEAAPTSPR